MKSVYLTNFQFRNGTIHHLISEDQPKEFDIVEMAKIHFKEMGLNPDRLVMAEETPEDEYYFYIEGSREDIHVNILEMEVVRFR